MAFDKEKKHRFNEELASLKQKAEEVKRNISALEAKNSEESKNYNALIDEAENFGSRDDWGTLDSGMVRFSEFLKLLRARAQRELP